MQARAVDAVMAARRAESFTKRSIKGASKQQALRLAMSMLDLTTLEGKDTPEKVRGLCRKAIHPVDVPAGRSAPVPSVPHVAAVCVYPMMVPVAKEALATGKSLREIVLENKLMDAATLDRTLDPAAMTKGGESALRE